MPRVSATMGEGVLSRWVKHEGDLVRKGDVLAEIETDKAIMELEAYDAGVLSQVLVSEGTTVPIGTPIAVIGAATDTRPPTPPATASVSPPTTPPPAPATVEPVAATPDARPSSATNLLLTSPLARNIAREHGVDLVTVTGTGPGGRIVRADVQALVDRQEATQRPTLAPSPQPRPPTPRTGSPQPALGDPDPPELP